MLVKYIVKHTYYITLIIYVVSCIPITIESVFSWLLGLSVVVMKVECEDRLYYLECIYAFFHVLWACQRLYSKVVNI